MEKQLRVVTLIGSLRRESYARRVVNALREQVRSGDAVLFATPEYNRSIPGVMKNAIDVGSRPFGASVWSGKPAVVLSVSPRRSVDSAPIHRAGEGAVTA